MTLAIAMFAISEVLYVLGALVREIEVGADGSVGRGWISRVITVLLVVSTIATGYLTLARLIELAL